MLAIADRRELDLWIQYRPTEGPLKGFRIKTQYSNLWQDNSPRDNQPEFESTYSSPGWRRAQAARAAAASAPAPFIDARARTVTTADSATSIYSPGERVFHQKFGYGRIVAVEGAKLLIDFDKAGSKRVMDGFVTRA